MAPDGDFPTRVLRLQQLEAVDETAVSVTRINQHLEGMSEPTRAMTTEEVESVLGDPFATLVLRRDVFPTNLTELLGALSAFDGDASTGLPDESSFLVSEGGQIPFEAGVDKGGCRLIVVRGRGGTAELMISVLLGPGQDPRAEGLLLEVQSWDPTNRTMHFYQRQGGAWFWCGQSDMALVPPTRGEGAWDSHVNGYPLMKELKSPWVHWHGPGLAIPESSFADDDPLIRDPLFTGKETADRFELSVIRPLAERWNEARFEKDSASGQIEELDQYVRQFAGSTTANLISTHKRWAQIDDGAPLGDVPPTFFLDVDGLLGVVGLVVSVPPLQMGAQTYKDLVARHDLRVRDRGVDQPGDLPFCFTVPERALEDTLGLRSLVLSRTVSRRLASAVLMVDFANPVFSARRTALAGLFPAAATVGDEATLDETVVAAARAHPSADTAGSPIAELLTNWDLGADAWEATMAQRLTNYLADVGSKLQSDEGCDEIFRLAESRRREFRMRPLAEFGLSLPQAAGIPEVEPLLEMGPDGSVQPKTTEESA